MMLKTYMCILDILESKVSLYTQSALFWLSFFSLFFTLPFHWWYCLIILCYKLCYIWINAFLMVKINKDELYDRYDKTGKLKLKIRNILNNKKPNK